MQCHKIYNFRTLKVNIFLKEYFFKNHEKVSIYFSNRKLGKPRVFMFYVYWVKRDNSLGPFG